MRTRANRIAGTVGMHLSIMVALLGSIPVVRADINQDQRPVRNADQPPPRPDLPLRGEAVPELPPGVLPLTHGLACGDVTEHSAILWARSSGEGMMHVAYSKDSSFHDAEVVLESVPSIGADDHTATLRIDGLDPATNYWYRIWFTREAPAIPVPQIVMQEGSFHTPPDSNVAMPVRFVWGGQLGGDDYCRGRDGYDVFEGMAALAPDFFVSVGDMIYADGDCPAEGPAGVRNHRNRAGDFLAVTDPSIDWSDLATVRETFWKHWRYNRADGHLQRLLASAPCYATWDDREVLDDFGFPWAVWNTDRPPRSGFSALVQEGRDAFLHYAPIDRVPGHINRIYRSFHWGRNLDLFLLDTRSYRSRNDAPDTGEEAKTMLGPEQHDWLRRSLIASAAVWKVIVCPAPLSIPVGDGRHGRDGWANGTDADSTGFEHELIDLLRALDQAGVHNVVFLTGDAGWAAEIRYARDFNDDGRPLRFHEVVAGPLSAQPTAPTALDPTLQPSPLYREGGFLGFGSVTIHANPDGKVHLVADIRGADGQVRPGSELDIAPE